MELSNPPPPFLKILMKLFYTLNKTLLGETGSSSNLYYLLANQASGF